jgi:anti-sigma regulatory factor (Ser/Thr protein kinase)
MHVDVETEATPEGAGRTRRALEVLQYHMPTGALATLQLLVSELVANGRRHAGGAGNAIRVSVNHSTSRVRVEVHDLQEGQPLRQTTLAEEDRSSWDLVLLDEMSDRWGTLDDTAGDVWFEIDYRHPSPRPEH